MKIINVKPPEQVTTTVPGEITLSLTTEEITLLADLTGAMSRHIAKRAGYDEKIHENIFYTLDNLMKNLKMDPKCTLEVSNIDGSEF